MNMNSLVISGVILGILPYLLSATSYELNQSNFEELVGCHHDSYLNCQINKHRNWFIMFYAPWCGHCKTSKPIFEQFASQYGQQLGNSPNQLAIGLVDCIENSGICRYFGIKGFPTFIYLPNHHQKAYQMQGGRTMKNFEEIAKNHENASISRQKQIGFTLFSQVLKILKQYWKEVLIFGFILPSIVGFLAAEFMTRRQLSQRKDKIQKSESQSQQPAVNQQEEVSNTKQD